MNRNYYSLWVNGYILSQDLLKDIGEDFYSYPVDTVELPHIDYESLGKKILDNLISKNKLDKGASIDIRKRKFDNDLHGVIDFNKSTNKVTITTNDRINFCKTRFTVVKELCQLYCEFVTSDKPFEKGAIIENEITTLVAKQASLLDSSTDVEIISSDSEYTEFLAYFMARNLIIPRSNREYFTYLMDFIKASPEQLTPFDVANFIKQPEFEIIALHGVAANLKEIRI